VNWRPCSPLKRPKKVCPSTFCHRTSNARREIQISTMKRRRRPKRAAPTTKRIIKRKSALWLRKRADPRTRSKVEPETIHIRAKAQTDRGRNLSSSFLAVVLCFLAVSFLVSIFLTTLNPLCFRASYASEHVNGGKFEESKKNAVREGKGGQPPSGGGNKKRLKSKKLVTGKHSNDDNIAITGQQQF